MTNAGGGATSDAATLTVNAAIVAPSISTHPSNATVTEGQTATFTVTASGTAPLSYRWQKGTTDITGATAATYTTPVTTMADNGATFRCVVTNAGGSATSDAAMLTVNAAVVAPSVSTHPSNATVTEGQTATFTFTASGTAPLSYRWQKGTTDITGATAATYTTPVTTMADNGATFRCVVTNAGGSATSDAATLTVNAAVVAPSISAQPSNATVTEGQTATFTVTASGTAPLSYRWQKGTTNITGATAASYTTPVTTMADNGATFRCVVTNAGGSATSDAAMLTVERESFTLTLEPGDNGSISPPGSQTIRRGDTVEVTAIAEASYRFVAWQLASGEALILAPESTTTGIVLTTGDAAVVATFAPITHTLTVAVAGHGTTEPSAPLTLHQGQVQLLTATADTGFHFTGWHVSAGQAVIAEPESATTEVILTDVDATVTAQFERTMYNLSIQRRLSADSSESILDTILAHGDTLRFVAPGIPEFKFVQSRR